MNREIKSEKASYYPSAIGSKVTWTAIRNICFN